MNAAAEPEASRQREWWSRTLAIFRSPRAVFAALRDDSQEAAEARGLLVFWLGGLMVHALARGLGGSSSFRQARHIVGFAAAPLVLSLLLVWPVRLAVYGGDVFRTGGSDSGVGDKIFEVLVAASFAWTLVLVAVGVWTVSGVTWPRRR